MSDPRRGYVAYLLRLWQVWEGKNAVWRASLEDPHTGERRGFATLQELFTYLETEACLVDRDPSTSNLSGPSLARDAFCQKLAVRARRAVPVHVVP